MSAAESPGVTFVIPVHNGATCVEATLLAVFAVERHGHEIEVIVIDDGSKDDTRRVLDRIAARFPLRILQGHGRGAAAAINVGVRAARHELIAQVDQDVVIDRDWLGVLLRSLEDPAVGATQGRYVTDRGAGAVVRAMSLDLEQRYAALGAGVTDHVCTGNSIYRRQAMTAAGLFDESLGYGYDNDLSYRLQRAGSRLAFRADAISRHRWREGVGGYLRQQYGFGYGRLDVLAKHPSRIAGDSVSPAPMMAHGVVMAVVVALFMIAGLLAFGGGAWEFVTIAGVVGLAALASERAWASAIALWRSRDAAALLFVPLHLLRDLAWVAAIIVWFARRLAGRHTRPGDSMRPSARPAAGATAPRREKSPDEPIEMKRVLGLIPVHNEAASLAAVVADIQRCRPALDILVIDDGSTDTTQRVIQALPVRWLAFPERLGIGSAMRAGLRYAARMHYDACIRLDGDGQHRAADIAAMLAPLHADHADVVLGSRYVDGRAARRQRRLPQRLLATCLSWLTGAPVTDPTSGFCAIGPRALRVLADHHPSGYPEPELRLFLSHNGLRVLEVPVLARPRLGGRTTLTTLRLAGAAARVLLAILIVPLRRQV